MEGESCCAHWLKKIIGLGEEQHWVLEPPLKKEENNVIGKIQKLSKLNVNLNKQARGAGDRREGKKLFTNYHEKANFFPMALGQHWG